MQLEVTRAGLVFDVRVAGPEDGPVVLLLHGFPQSAACWEVLVPLLTAAGFRTVAPDQRGYSPRARPRRRRDYRIGELVADVTAVADAVSPGRPLHVVGHDWGGGVAWVFRGAAPGADGDGDGAVVATTAGAAEVAAGAVPGAGVVVPDGVPAPVVAGADAAAPGGRAGVVAVRADARVVRPASGPSGAGTPRG